MSTPVPSDIDPDAIAILGPEKAAVVWPFIRMAGWALTGWLFEQIAAEAAARG